MGNQHVEPNTDTQRQLAAVLFLDMVGYSALMQQSASGAQAAVDTLWGIARPLIARHGGEEIRRFGDGMLLTFTGTVAAAQCCVQIFAQLAEHNRTNEQIVQARAGLHLGDIGRRDGEIFGDGVNIAARLVELAPPGSTALSPHVREQLANTLAEPLKSLGVKRLKNINQPLEVFCLPGPECSAEALDAAAARGEAPAWHWRFGLASYDERAREVHIGGQPVKLDARSLDVLQALLKHAGEIVSRTELREAAGDIADSSLNRIIGRLRQALRDRDHSQIRTQPGHGYRLDVPVSVEAAPSAQLTQFDFRPGDHPPLRPLWSLQCMLGQGAQGEVWLARHEKTGEERVYKFALEDERLGALKREITLSRALRNAEQSEHFIRVLDWNLERPPYFIECEYGGSQNLAAWAEAQGSMDKVPLATRLELIAQIADALAAAHSVGVLHKDLKPANVLVHQLPGDAPSIKLADFGSGGVLDAGMLDAAGITRMGFTRSLLLGSEGTHGTPMYFAPEILAGQIATVQADIYALGVMLYQIVVGDLRRSLAPGWEKDIDDELLREDIAAAAAGNPVHRLADASQIAERLRTLGPRREERATQRAAWKKSQQAQRELERMRARRVWVWSTIGVLIIGTLTTLTMYFQAESARRDAERSAAITQAVSDFLNRDILSLPDIRRTAVGDLTVKKLLQRASNEVESRFADQPEARGEVHLALAYGLSRLGEYSLAFRHAGKALPLFEEAYGRKAPNTMRARYFKAMYQMAAEPGKYKDRRPEWQELLAYHSRSNGATAFPTLWLRIRMGQDHLQYGNYPAAISEFRDTLHAAQSADTPDHSTLSELKQLLGTALGKAGKLEQADATLREVLSKRRIQYGEDNFFTAITQLHLGELLTEAGKYEEADRLLQKATSTYDAWLDEGHHLRAYPRVQLGALRLEERRPERAVQLLEASLAICRNSSGCPNHVADSILERLAAAQIRLGQFSNALAALRPVIQSHAATWGPDHRNTVRARILLADALRLQGDYAGARTVLGKIDAEAAAALGELSPVRAELLRVQGLIFRDEGRLKQAETALRKSTDLYTRRLGRNHWRTQRAKRELAGL